MRSAFKTRAARGSVALLTGVALVGGGAGVAFAEPGAALPGQNGETTAYLNIHKHHTPRTTLGDGTVESPTSPPIAGVKFDVCKVNSIDLTTRAGWEAAQDLLKTGVVDDDVDDFDVEKLQALAPTGLTCSTYTTGADGIIRESLPLGLYLVTETDRSGAFIDANNNGVLDAGERVNALKVDPFAVTLPLSDPDSRDKWMYDVHVYPKNDTVDITKTVNDENVPNKAVVLGDDVVYTITADVPAPGNRNESLTRFVITDDLDSRLDYLSATLAGVGVTLTEGADYTIVDEGPTASDSDDVPLVQSTAGSVVKVKFSRSGLDKLWNAANASQDVKVELTLTTAANASGEIPNKAVLDVNSGEVRIETEDVYTKFGSIDLLKVSDFDAFLPGAVFELYANKDDALAQTNRIGVDTNGDQVADKFTWTTDADGKVSVNGLRYEGWENNATDGTPITYWLVERVAPVGYELLADPVEVTGVWGDQVETTPDFTIENVKHNAGFALPKVGGVGIAVFSVVGAGAALLFVVLMRRRQTEDA